MVKFNTVFDCSLMQLPKIHNRAGNITPINGNVEVPFQIRRVYYLYDVPGGEDRGGHAHYELQQFIVAASGSFDVLLDDGINKRTVSLNRPYFAIHVVPGIWRELTNFSSGSICMVLASHIYEASDYIRDYNLFLDFKKNLTK
jgi:hypothetical protein